MHIITYIRFLIAKACVILEIYSFSSIVAGHFLYANLKWEASGVTTNFASTILNFSNIILRYFFCGNHNFFLFLSRIIFILNILLAGPKFFIAKFFLTYSFKLSIIILSLPVINIKSTYNNNIIKSCSISFNVYTMIWIYPFNIMIKHEKSNFV